MKTDKAIDAMRHLLMVYANDMQYIPNKISAFANSSEHLDFDRLTAIIDQEVEKYAMIEQKSNIIKSFLTQMLTQTAANVNVAPTPQREEQ